MRINGNYNSSANYDHTSHHHHITKCLHETQNMKKFEGNIKSSVSAEEKQQTAVEYSRETVTQSPDILIPQQRKNHLFQSIKEWFGQEGVSEHSTTGYKKVRHSESEFLRRGINTVIFTVKEGVPNYVTDRLAPLRERLKVGIHTALKRFGRDSRSFGALTDPGTGSLLNKNKDRDAKSDKKEKGTRQQGVTIESAVMTEEHLMDSYSNSGKYCKLNENLTYRQGRAPYKISDINKPED